MAHSGEAITTTARPPIEGARIEQIDLAFVSIRGRLYRYMTPGTAARLAGG